MKSVFARNLVKVRHKWNLTQEAAADQIGLKRSSLGAYEEGRAEPSIPNLTKIIEAYSISDVKGFLSDPNFLVEKVDLKISVEARFKQLRGPVREAVTILLGLNVENGK